MLFFCYRNSQMLKLINDDNQGFSILKSLYWFIFWLAELRNPVENLKKGPVSYILACLRTSLV